MSRVDPHSNVSQSARGGALLIGLILLVAVGKPILCDTMDPDCFWHLKVAEQLESQLRHGAIGPIVDHLSFASSPKPWTPYSWLAELGMNWLWQTLGWRAAVLAHAVMSGALMLLIAMACRCHGAISVPLSRYSGAGPGRGFFHDSAEDPHPSPLPEYREREQEAAGDLPVALATAAAAVLSLAYLSFRPVTAALVLLALCGWILVRDRRSGERTTAFWLLPFIAALIVNIHLYAIFVPIWVGSLWLGALYERWRAPADGWAEAHRRALRYGVLLVGTFAACMATPMLPGVVEAIVHYQSQDPMVAGGAIAEMKPFYTGISGAISAGIVLTMAGCALLGRRQLRAGEWIWLAGATVILFRLGRFAPVFALVAAPIFASTMPRLSARVLQKRAVVAAIAIVLIIGVVRMGLSFPRGKVTLDAWLQRQGPDAPGFPCAAADFVDSRLKPATGRLINEFTWGGYLEWRFAGRYQTLLDGRTQVFSPEFWHGAYLGSEQDRSRLLAKVNADAAILPARKSKFQSILQQQGWQIAYRDDWAVVMTPPEREAHSLPIANVPLGE